ncbi:methyltransferase type 11, partial [Methylobacterium sp. J-070]|nr:methyltransferase type 11 [Methylobacterium sp. J-070]
MRLDVNGLRAFYASPLGRTTHRVVGRALHEFLGSVSGLRVLGIGY